MPVESDGRYCSTCGSTPCQCDSDGYYDDDDDGYYDDEPPEYISEPGHIGSYFCPSFNPDIKFLGDGPLFFGVELEITASRGAQAKIAYDAMGGSKYRFGWLKSDCSVRGFELATQPMSYPYFMREFPWDMLPALEQAGCRIVEHTNGMHIHVSRGGFKDVPHQYRWMKLIYRNQWDVTRLGGRDSEWGEFRSTVQRSQVNHLKIRKMRDAKKILPYEMYRLDIASRYDAINVQPLDTFEIRAFASTLDKDKARTRLQLAAASVDYTRNLTANDVIRGDGWAWPVFKEWVLSHGETYPQLAKVA